MQQGYNCDLNDIDVVKNILIRTQIKLIEMMQKNGMLRFVIILLRKHI